MMLTIQLLVSAAIVLAVLWFMWRLPRDTESLWGWGPPLALLGPWSGLAAVIISTLLWRADKPDAWLPIVFLILDPVSIGSGVLVLWLYRGRPTTEQTVQMQRLQAKAAITLGLLAVAIGYAYVMTHKTPFTPVGQ
jgi:hypothetical protein